MEEKIIFGSHNSMSYLPIKNKWLSPFGWVAKCQNRTLIGQIDAGAEILDFRIALDKDSRWKFRHGVIKYDMSEEHEMYRDIIDYDSASHIMDNDESYNMYDDDIIYCLDIIRKKYPNKHLYIRIILEKTRKGKENLDKIEFELLCCQLEERYKGHFTFLGGNYKPDWEKLYNFKNAIDYEKSFSQWVSSMQPNAFILTRICPWIYAKLYNMKNRKKKQSEFNTYDFIDKELLLK